MLLTMDRPFFPAPRVDLSFEKSGALAVLKFAGAIRADDLHRASRSLIDRLAGATLAGLVLDARDSTPDYTPGQLSDALEPCFDLSSPERCAFVTREVREDTLKLLETAGVPFAVRVRGFLDLEDGKRWAAGL